MLWLLIGPAVVGVIIVTRQPRHIQPAALPAAPYLHSLVGAYGQSTELMGTPDDRTPELDESRPPGLSGRITAQTRGGQIRFEDYTSIPDRQNAQQRVVQWQTSTPPGEVTPAYASCERTLVVLTGYTNPAAEYEDVIAADQLLHYTSNDNCGEG